ncbi:MAG: hypothetical protein NT121_01245, partial [Chloroflexi bacterium]|nr:hypothetical protein [Chloroflexota bacterium]
MLLLIMLVSLALLSWIIFKPEWMPAPPENDISKKVVYGADVVKQKSAGWFNQVKPLWQKNTSQGAQLKSWSTQPDLAKLAGFSKQQSEILTEFQAWIDSISNAEADLVAQELDGFCKKQGVNLGWLLEDNGKADMLV